MHPIACGIQVISAVINFSMDSFAAALQNLRVPFFRGGCRKGLGVAAVPQATAQFDNLLGGGHGESHGDLGVRQ